MTEKPTATTVVDSPAPSPALKRLEVFVGTWDTDGKTRASDDAPSLSVRAIDSYEWLPGGFFLLHRITAHIGDDDVQGIEMIGYDEKTDSYPMHYFDSRGTASVGRARVHDGTWTITGPNERATLKVLPSGDTLTATWERRTNGSHWEPWMDITLKRAG